MFNAGDGKFGYTMVDFETINILLSSNILKFFVLFGVLLIYYRWYRRPNNFPPGPRGIPILGAVPWLSKNPAKTFAAWSNKYGSILSVRMGSEDWIILNDYESIHEVKKLNIVMVVALPHYLLLKFAQWAFLTSPWIGCKPSNSK